MPDIRHRVGIAAPLGDVYDAVATREGVAGWWCGDVEGESCVGDALVFPFGRPEPRVTMEITELAAPSRVRWRCIQGPEEWKGTSLTFDVRSEGDETVLVFTHGDWREPGEFMHHCSTKWGYFLLGLKAGFEGGRATPWPGDRTVSSWG